MRCSFVAVNTRNIYFAQVRNSVSPNFCPDPVMCSDNSRIPFPVSGGEVFVVVDHAALSQINFSFGKALLVAFSMMAAGSGRIRRLPLSHEYRVDGLTPTLSEKAATPPLFVTCFLRAIRIGDFFMVSLYDTGKTMSIGLVDLFFYSYKHYVLSIGRMRP